MHAAPAAPHFLLASRSLIHCLAVELQPHGARLVSALCEPWCAARADWARGGRVQVLEELTLMRTPVTDDVRASRLILEQVRAASGRKRQGARRPRRGVSRDSFLALRKRSGAGKPLLGAQSAASASQR